MTSLKNHFTNNIKGNSPVLN